MDKLNWYSAMFQYHPTACHTEDSTASIIAKRTAELMPPKEYHRLLDLGCGDGLTTKRLKDIGYDAVGITLGEKNVDRGIEIHDITIELMDMHDLLFPPNSFDAVLANHSFEHSYAPFILVCEVRRILRVGGRWFINMPHYDGDHAPITYHHPSVLPPKQMKELLTHLGFNVVKSSEAGKKWGFDYYFLVEKDRLTKCHGDVQRVLKKAGEII